MVVIVNVKAVKSPPHAVPLFVPDELSPIQSANKWLKEKEEAAGSSSSSIESLKW